MADQSEQQTTVAAGADNSKDGKNKQNDSDHNENDRYWLNQRHNVDVSTTAAWWPEEVELFRQL